MNARLSTSALASLALFAFAAAARGQYDVSAPAATTLAAPAASSSAASRVLAEITRQLSDQLRPEGDLQLEWTRAWAPPATLAADAPIDVAILEAPAALSASLIVRVRLQSAGVVVGETTFALRAQLLREVWVARGSLERETPFDVSQLDSRRVDVLRERDAVPATDANSDFNYTRTIQAGRVVTWRDLARRALVRRGQVIEVAAIDGPLTITMKALAMENGAAGQMVKVRNLETKKEFNAQVVSASRAQVRF